MIQFTDQELILMALAQKTSAFDELVRRHQRAIRHWLGKVCGDYTLADDMAQDTFLKAWTVLSSYQGKGEFRHWLLKIAWTTFLQTTRKHKQLKNLVEQVETYGVQQQEQAPEHSQPELEQLLGILSAEERACMTLSYSHGYSHGEVSAMLSLPLGTVKSIIRRSLIKIREHFDIPVEGERHG